MSEAPLLKLLDGSGGTGVLDSEAHLEESEHGEKVLELRALRLGPGDDLLELLGGSMLVLLGRQVVGDVLEGGHDALELAVVEPDAMVSGADVDADPRMR